MNPKPLITRLAPTPSGYLHAGNGISFIITWAIARAAGGRVLLRIDDLDGERTRPEYIEDIFRTLDWLGLDYDLGPSSPDDFFKNYSQHLRLDIYQSYIQKLIEKERLYTCYCSRKTINLNSINGLYPLTCRPNTILPPYPPHQKDTAWRIKVDNNAAVTFAEWLHPSVQVSLNEVMGDFIVLQKNGLPAYQVASLADDVHFGVNFIVRGQDLLHSTAAQVFLANQLESLSFAQNTFFHHPLLTNTEGDKLSKSKGDTALHEWRTALKRPFSLFQKAAEWLELMDISIDNASDLVASIKEKYIF